MENLREGLRVVGGVPLTPLEAWLREYEGRFVFEPFTDLARYYISRERGEVPRIQDDVVRSLRAVADAVESGVIRNDEIQSSLED